VRDLLKALRATIQYPITIEGSISPDWGTILSQRVVLKEPRI